MDLRIERQIACLVEQLFPESSYKVNFQLKSFSKEPLGFQGVHKLLIIEARKFVESIFPVEIRRFFVKTSVPNCNDHQLKLFNREPKFFGDVVPRLLQFSSGKAWAPKCYLAQDGMLIFEDLKSQGFEVMNQLFDETHLRSLFSCLARFHAASMLFEEYQGQSIDVIYPNVFNENMFMDDGKFTWKWLTTGIEVLEAIANRLGLDSKCITKAYRLTLEVVKPSADECNVICHSDLWRNNMMFDKSGENCRLVDFQLSSYKCYALDLVQALYLNARKSVRKTLEQNLIQHYSNELKKSLCLKGYERKSISTEEVLEAINKKRILGLVSAVQILPIALLNKQFSYELFHDSDSLTRHMYVSRKELILRAMDNDVDFRSRIEEAITELIDYMNDYAIN